MPSGEERDRLYDLLPPRERQVLDLVAEGLSDPEIAARLGEAMDRTFSMVRGLLIELGFRSRADAVRYVLDRATGEGGVPAAPEDVLRDQGYQRLMQEPDPPA